MIFSDARSSSNIGSVQVEFAQRLARVRRLLRLLQSLREALVEHVFLVLFRLLRLAEEALSALLCFAQMARGLVEVLKGPLARSRRVRDHCPRCRIDFQHRSAVRTCHFDNRIVRAFSRHTSVPVLGVYRSLRRSRQRTVNAHSQMALCPGQSCVACSTSVSTKAVP